MKIRLKFKLGTALAVTEKDMNVKEGRNELQSDVVKHDLEVCCYLYGKP